MAEGLGNYIFSKRKFENQPPGQQGLEYADCIPC